MKKQLNWDGEKINMHVEVPDQKFTPKEMIESLNHARGQLRQMEQQKTQLKGNINKIETDILSVKEYIKNREIFEEKCNELQLKTLKHYITQISEECKEIAVKDAEKEIAEAPDSMTANQKENLFYVKYQNKLATHKKVAKGISSQVIQAHLFVKPIFENPFSSKKD